MESDDRNATRARDSEWLARQPRLDRALTDAIRAPTVDARFDERVWGLIRADEAATSAMSPIPARRLGAPWWLGALNVVAVAATAFGITLALRAAAAKPLAASVAAALSFAGHATTSVLLVLLSAAAGLWFALRPTPLAPETRAWP